MKTKKINKSDFKPFKISIKVESLDDLKLLWHRFNLNYDDLFECSISGFNDDSFYFINEEIINNDLQTFKFIDNEMNNNNEYFKQKRKQSK